LFEGTVRCLRRPFVVQGEAVRRSKGPFIVQGRGPFVEGGGCSSFEGGDSSSFIVGGGRLSFKGGNCYYNDYKDQWTSPVQFIKVFI
jgi:hypothetical protein